MKQCPNCGAGVQGDMVLCPSCRINIQKAADILVRNYYIPPDQDYPDRWKHYCRYCGSELTYPQQECYKCNIRFISDKEEIEIVGMLPIIDIPNEEDTLISEEDIEFLLNNSEKPSPSKSRDPPKGGNYKNEREAIQSLKRCYVFAPGEEIPQNEIISIINSIEREFPNSRSWELELLLGKSLVGYTSFSIRGDDRKPYYERILAHYIRAYELSKRDDIALVIGHLLIENAVIRDLDRGISYISPIFESKDNYEPEFCAYADAFYKKGDFRKVIEITEQTEAKCGTGKVWGVAPPAVFSIRAKAYRGLIKELQKNDRYEEAFMYLQRMVDQGIASENDKKKLEKRSS